MPLPLRRPPTTPGAPPWFAVRDAVTSTRVAGVFALCGAFYILVNSAITGGSSPGGGRALEITVAIGLALVSLPPALLPARVPAPTAAVLASVSVLVVLHLDLVTDDTSFGAQVYLAWPVLYAAYHLQTRGAWAVCAQCVAAHAALLLGTGGVAALALDGPAFAATVAILTWTLSSARDRAAAAYGRLHTEATEDVLTGLATRRAFEAALRTALRRSEPVAVVLCDVDHFKAVNDGDGHALGDLALQAVSRELREAFAGEAVVARYGGDELAVVLAGTAARNAPAVAEEFRRRVEALRLQRTELAPTGSPAHLRLTVSVGVVVREDDPAGGTGPDAGRGPELLLTAADQALYAAKRAGRNRVVRAGHPDDAVLPPRPRAGGPAAHERAAHGPGVPSPDRSSDRV